MPCLKKYVQLYLKQMLMCSLLKDSEKMSGRLCCFSSVCYHFIVMLLQMLDGAHAERCNFLNKRVYVLLLKILSSQGRIKFLG